MKILFLLGLGLAIILFTACVDYKKMVKVPDFDSIATEKSQERTIPLELAIEKAKTTWEKTKSIGEIVWNQRP